MLLILRADDPFGRRRLVMRKAATGATHGTRYWLSDGTFAASSSATIAAK
jgi:hypothetical protein